ncbi:MAG: hypothetical protein MJ132_06375, partial [Clostridia bacterium]|nr:hypothetical protein [Clostridia bacterium]
STASIETIFNSINIASRGGCKLQSPRDFLYYFIFTEPLQNRVPGNKTDRRRWRMQGGFVGTAVEIARRSKAHRQFRAPQEGCAALRSPLPLPKSRTLQNRIHEYRGFTFSTWSEFLLTFRIGLVYNTFGRGCV